MSTSNTTRFGDFTGSFMCQSFFFLIHHSVTFCSWGFSISKYLLKYIPHFIHIVFVSLYYYYTVFRAKILNIFTLRQIYKNIFCTIRSKL